MDLDRHLAEYHEQGFTAVPDLIEPDMIEELKHAIEIALKKDQELYGGLPGKADFIALDLVHYGGVFLDFLDNDKIDRLFAALLGDKWILYSFTSTVARPHLDQYTAQIHNETSRIVPDYDLAALLTFALSDFTEENGATWYMPGSHRTHPEKPSEDEFYSKAIQVTRQAGGAAFFHPRTWHAGAMNTTDETRYGCALYACRSFMRQRFDFPRMVDEELLAGTSERVRRILGFNVRVPTSLEQFYVAPEDRLYKAGQG